MLPSGQNVYPDDIQAVLNRHPGVTDSSVVGLPRAGGVEVHAALILEGDHDPEAIVSWANAQLAEQQYIRGFTVWQDEDFPRTHTLKVRKPALIDALIGVAATGPSGTTTPLSQSRQAPNSARRRDGAPSLAEIIAEVAPVEAAEVTHNMTLGKELGLDSLGRVELLSAVETHLGVYLDESEVDSETTVGRLQRLLEESAANPVMNRFPAWGMRWWCRMARGFLQRTMLFPAVLAPYSLSVHGQERLRGVEGPVLFASNHHLGLDNPLIIKAIPQTWRRRLAIAAAAKLWRNPVRSVLNPLLGNGFPLAQDGPIRPSLENMGRILDSGWSVLIYPEGKLTVGGPILPFKNGTGLVAVEGRLPVVPMKLQIKRFGSPAKYPILRRGSVEIRFGEPMVFPPRTAYQDATDAIEEAVRAL